MELARQGLKSIVRWVTGLTEIERTLLTSQEPAALSTALFTQDARSTAPAR